MEQRYALVEVKDYNVTIKGVGTKSTMMAEGIKMLTSMNFPVTLMQEFLRNSKYISLDLATRIPYIVSIVKIGV